MLPRPTVSPLERHTMFWADPCTISKAKLVKRAVSTTAVYYQRVLGHRPFVVG